MPSLSRACASSLVVREPRRAASTRAVASVATRWRAGQVNGRGVRGFDLALRSICMGRQGGRPHPRDGYSGLHGGVWPLITSGIAGVRLEHPCGGQGGHSNPFYTQLWHFKRMAVKARAAGSQLYSLSDTDRCRRVLSVGEHKPPVSTDELCESPLGAGTNLVGSGSKRSPQNKNGRRRTSGANGYEDWSKESLIAHIEKLERRKKYGLIWDEEKTKEIFEEESEHKLPILKTVPGKWVGDVGTNHPNVLIQGDNYHALSVLQYTHKNKVDIIYIDPPYNTGNGETFKYNDKIINADDMYKHSKWLSFMKKRISLSKKLMKDTGVIFISIDDHEYAQLKLLCNEIFDEKNYVATIIWQKKYVAANDAKGISTTHEYILVYARNKSCWRPGLFKRTQQQLAAFQNADGDPRGLWRPSDLSARTYNAKSDYVITGPTGKKFSPPPSRSWTVNKTRFKELLDDDRITFGKNDTGRPMLKKFLTDVRQGITPDSWWSRDKADDNKAARYEIKDLFPNNTFSTPKPTKLIKLVIQTAGAGKQAVILDFFAGSGTTGHAVLQLNKEDGGNRSFVLCTNNEGKICTDVCHPRLKKVINGYMTPKHKKVEGLGGNLAYFRTAFVDAAPTDKNKKILTEQSTEMLCLKENCFRLENEHATYRVYTNNTGKYLGIVYYYDGIEPFKEFVKKTNKHMTAYVFSLSDDVDHSDFTEISDMVTLKPIPSTILNVYRRMFAYVDTAALSRKAR